MSRINRPRRGASARRRLSTDSVGAWKIRSSIIAAVALAMSVMFTALATGATADPTPAATTAGSETVTMSWVMADPNGSASNLTFPQYLLGTANADAITCGHVIQNNVYKYYNARARKIVDALRASGVLNKGDDYAVAISHTFTVQAACVTTPPSSTPPTSTPPTSTSTSPGTSPSSTSTSPGTSPSSGVDATTIANGGSSTPPPLPAGDSRMQPGRPAQFSSAGLGVIILALSAIVVLGAAIHRRRARKA